MYYLTVDHFIPFRIESSLQEAYLTLFFQYIESKKFKKSKYSKYFCISYFFEFFDIQNIQKIFKIFKK